MGYQSVNFIDRTGFIERTIALEFGNYAYNDVCDILTQRLNSSGLTGTYSVSFNTHNNKFTISNSSETFGINWATSQYDDQPEYKKLSYVMGFNNVNLDLQSSYTSDFTANLSGGMSLYIKSSALSYMLTSYFENKGSTVIATCPVNVSYGSIINYYDPLTILQFNNTNFINVFDFQLVDEYNNIVDLNGMDWSFNIVFFSEPY